MRPAIRSSAPRVAAFPSWAGFPASCPATATRPRLDASGSRTGGLNSTRRPECRSRGRVVLEAGCGAGRFTELLLAGGARVVAFDLSRAVEANRENCGHWPEHFV